MSTVLTRDAIQQIDDRSIEPCEVPEWGGMLYIKGLTGRARDKFDMTLFEQRKNPKGKVISQEMNLENMRAKLIVQCAVDGPDPDTAKLIFQPEDAEWLGEKLGAALQRLYEVAMRLSGLSNEQVDEMTQTLGNAPSGDSGSDSPVISDSLLTSVNDGSAPSSSVSG